MNKLSVIIPSYKEEENLKIIIPRLLTVLKKVEPLFEILIVDTMQPMDGTEKLCEGFGPHVRYIKRQESNSFGSAVRTGIKNSQSEYVVFMDADGSHDPEFISKLYEYRKDFDVVIASRYVEGGVTKNSKSLVMMSRLLNLTYSVVLNLNCHDVSNSFKLYKTSSLKKLDLYCDNFDIVEEILFKLKKQNKNLKIKEVPFTFNQRMFGETKRNLFSFILTYLYTMIKLRFGK